MEEATVDCLIDEGTRKWNVVVIGEIFAPQEVEEIKNIPLARKDMEDSLFWPLENDGRYSCKTGYRFLKEDEVGHQVAVQQDHEKGLWKKVCALECPNKVRNLMWRACHNSLSSKCNLFRRRIISEQCCDRCKVENEYTVHAMWSCKMLDDIWSANNSWNFRNQQYFSSFSELMVWILDHQRNPALFAFTVWSILASEKSVTDSGSPLTSEPHFTMGSRQLGRIQGAEFTTQWKPPVQEMMKINFDGAIFAEEKSSGMGVIIRDRKGLVIASMATWIPQQLWPVEIEALAASKALEFARELGIADAVLEGDSQVVIMALNSKNTVLAPFGSLVQDSLTLSTSFSKLSYSHTKRDGNPVAHNLAKLAVNLTNCVIWMEDVPSDVLSSYLI